MIHFDGIHMATDGAIDELHCEAARIGLRREWFQSHPRHPHYDVWGAPAMKLTVNCTSRELLQRTARTTTTRQGGISMRIVARLQADGVIRQVSGSPERVAEWVLALPQPELSPAMAAFQARLCAKYGVPSHPLTQAEVLEITALVADEGCRWFRGFQRQWGLTVERPKTPGEVLRDREETRNAPLEDDPLAQHLMRQSIADGHSWACDEVRAVIGLGPNGTASAAPPPDPLPLASHTTGSQAGEGEDGDGAQGCPECGGPLLLGPAGDICMDCHWAGEGA